METHSVQTARLKPGSFAQQVAPSSCSRRAGWPVRFLRIFAYRIYIWVGLGWDINVLTTTSLILRCQRMFHQLGRPWWCNMMLRWQHVGVGWDINVLTTTSLMLRCQRRFHQLGRPWWCNMMLRWQHVGVGWDINVLTTTSLILRCQRMFHQLGRHWWCNVMLGWRHVRTRRKRRFSGSGVAIRMWNRKVYTGTNVQGAGKALQVACLNVENDADTAAHRPPDTAWPSFTQQLELHQAVVVDPTNRGSLTQCLGEPNPCL